MNPNQHVTPETGKLLEEAGLVKKEKTAFVWFRRIGATKWTLICWQYRIADYDDLVEYIPAPTFGEIWDLLPNSIPIFLDGKPRWLAYKQLRLDGHNQFNEKQMPVESVICYRELIQDGEEILFPEHIMGGNIADAAGRLLLKIHKEVKLK